MSFPTISVQLALGDGWAASSFTWTDITTYVENPEGIQIEHGRKDEVSIADSDVLQLVLNNTDGRFTPLKTGGAYYPNIRKGVPIRVRATWNAVTYDRFFGYIDDWPVVWPGGLTFFSTTAVTAHGVTARFSRSATMKSLITEVIMADDPIAYYPLTEDGGVSFAGDISTNALPAMKRAQRGSGGSLVFGEIEDGGPIGADGEPFVRFDRSSETNGKFLEPVSATQVLWQENNTFTAVECFFRTTTRSDHTPCQIYIPGGNEELEIRMQSASGKIEVEAVLFDGVDTYFIGSNATANAYDDGKWHHAVAWLERASSTTMTAKIMVDGTDTASVGPYTRPSTGGNPIHPEWTRLRIGSDHGDDVWDGDISHVAVYSKPQSAAMSTTASTVFAVHADAGRTGFNPQSVGARLNQYATFAGFPTSRVTTNGSTNLGHVQTKDQAPLEAMRVLERTDGGVLFDGRNGNLTYNSRSTRYSTTSSFTLDAQAGHLERDIEFRLDDQFLINEVTGSRQDGGLVRVVDETSRSLYGPYTQDLDIAGTDDNHVLAAAQWLVSRYAEPEIRVPSITVSLHGLSTSLVTSLLSADVGTRLTISNLPSQAPFTSAQFFIEGYTETIDPDAWLITFYLSPVDNAEVWLLGDSTYGVLGTTTTLGY